MIAATLVPETATRTVRLSAPIARAIPNSQAFSLSSSSGRFLTDVRCFRRWFPNRKIVLHDHLDRSSPHVRRDDVDLSTRRDPFGPSSFAPQSSPNRVPARSLALPRRSRQSRWWRERVHRHCRELPSPSNLSVSQLFLFFRFDRKADRSRFRYCPVEPRILWRLPRTRRSRLFCPPRRVCEFVPRQSLRDLASLFLFSFSLSESPGTRDRNLSMCSIGHFDWDNRACLDTHRWSAEDEACVEI